jgi:hypothetical protein
MRWLFIGVIGAVVAYEIVARLAEYNRRHNSETEERQRVARYVREQPPHELYY